MKKIIIITTCLILSKSSIAQIQFYIGSDILSTKVYAKEEAKKFSTFNLTDFGLYLGNELIIKHKISIGIDFFYQNNQTTIKQIKLDESKFEFHQNIGLRLKPTLNHKKNKIGLIAGLTGVYVFDKKEIIGNQIDRYDEAYLYGIEYNRAINQKWSINLTIQKAKFNSISHYTNSEMISYFTTTIGLQYNIYGNNVFFNN